MRVKDCLKYLVLIIFIQFAQLQSIDVNYLEPGKLLKSEPHHGYERLSIYCYRGIPKNILHFWETVQLQLIIDGKDWESYIGHASNDVVEEYEQHRSIWSFNFPFSRKSDLFFLNTFNNSCVGIQTATDHSAYLQVWRFDYWRIILFLAGLTLFFASRRLSSNPLFHYTCGIALGVSTSILIIIYFASKLFPTKPAVYGFLAGGWAIGAYLVKLIISNLRTIAQSYQNYVLGYFATAAFISFGICYRYGPVKNHRTLALIRWSLQWTGLAAIYLSSDFYEAAIAVMAIIVVYQIFPSSFCSWLYAKWCVRFPPKLKPLTEDEYREQGIRETAKALEELRTYCSSPECKQWKTVLALKEPLRFAEFVEGGFHLSDDEISEYEENPPLKNENY